MDGTISAQALGTFFAWAPLTLGVVIFFIAWLSKRHEGASSAPVLGTTYACAKCGKRGVREHMLPQTHEGAVSYYCNRCG